MASTWYFYLLDIGLAPQERVRRTQRLPHGLTSTRSSTHPQQQRSAAFGGIGLASNLRILIYSAFGGSDRCDRARQTGAAGFLLKGTPLPTLARALQTVSRGGKWWHQPLGHPAAQARPSGPSTGRNHRLDRIPDRQRQVLELTILGYPAKTTASQLGLSLRTVEFHRAALRARLGVRSTAELIHAASGTLFRHPCEGGVGPGPPPHEAHRG
jgi:DNA-binding NarL/FixJ family response regulator